MPSKRLSNSKTATAEKPKKNLKPLNGVSKKTVQKKTSKKSQQFKDKAIQSALDDSSITSNILQELSKKKSKQSGTKAHEGARVKMNNALLKQIDTMNL